MYEDNRAGISSLPFALQVLQIPYFGISSISGTIAM